jgi:putative membrane protein
VTAALPGLPLLLAAGAYALGVRRLGRRGDTWPALQTAATVAGLLGLAAALLPPVATHDDDPRVHVAQHLVMAMLAPLLLALGAPVTLALRALRTPGRRRLLAVLGSPVVRVAVNPIVVLVLDVGGMYAYYLTGLHRLAEEHAWLHALAHAHMITAGCLLAWLVVGPDPVRGRPGALGRMAVLVVAGAAHDVLAKLLYVRAWGSAAELLYYGGEVVDVLLGVAVLGQWYARGGRELARAGRRQAATVPEWTSGPRPPTTGRASGRSSPGSSPTARRTPTPST